jgi:hypothetical protein
MLFGAPPKRCICGGILNSCTIYAGHERSSEVYSFHGSSVTRELVKVCVGGGCF